MLRSFAPFISNIMAGVIGAAVVATIFYLIFALADAEKGERLGIVVKSILALIAMIVLGLIATIAFSFIAFVGFVVVALWVFSSIN